MREGRAGEFEGLAAVPHVDLAVQVGDLVRVGGDVHAAEGVAGHYGEAEGDALQVQRPEPVCTKEVIRQPLVQRVDNESVE